MKVSKSILVALILAVLFAAYSFLFTDKKVQSTFPVPVTNIAGTTPQAPYSTTGSKTPKLNVDTLNLSWQNDPFSLPKSVMEKKAEKPKIALKLVAIMESNAGRYAIIGGEIVKKGDKIGEEKVVEIHNDRVVLIRNNTKRILSIEDTR